MAEVKAKNTITLVMGILLTCLTLLNAWQMVAISEQNKQIAEQNKQIQLQNIKFDNLPEKYVRFERYTSDTRDIKATVCQLRDSLQLDMRSLSIDIKDLSKKMDLQFSIDRKKDNNE